MRPLLTLAALALLAACSTPREQCENRAVRDLRVVDRLIAENRAILERGYAIQTVETVRPRMTLCRVSEDRSEICWVDDIRRSTRPVAVNLNEVRATLASLVDKRAELEVRARAELAACQALPDR
jgi:hypothetical protein